MLNFLLDPSLLPEGVTEEMVVAYKGEDAEESEESEDAKEKPVDAAEAEGPRTDALDG